MREKEAEKEQNTIEKILHNREAFLFQAKVREKGNRERKRKGETMSGRRRNVKRRKNGARESKELKQMEGRGKEAQREEPFL